MSEEFTEEQNERRGALQYRVLCGEPITPAEADELAFLTAKMNAAMPVEKGLPEDVLKLITEVKLIKQEGER